MRRLLEQSLADEALAQLESWQKQLDALGTYEERVHAAKELFASRNTRANATFKRVRATLAAMCAGAMRCAYCENSTAAEVEHVRPKSLYPEYAFAWANYVYSCGPCNRWKLAHWAIFLPSDQEVDVTRPRTPTLPLAPPTTGRQLFIDPRSEDPEQFLALDLLGTFLVVPRLGISAIDRRRAEYTIALIGLSERDDLALARATHYDSYRARLVEYVAARDAKKPPTELARHVASLQRMDHPFVWSEMKRQHTRLSDLHSLFLAAPEALLW